MEFIYFLYTFSSHLFHTLIFHFSICDFSCCVFFSLEVLRNKFLKWKEAFETNGIKIILGKTNVMVSSITKDV